MTTQTPPDGEAIMKQAEMADKIDAAFCSLTIWADAAWNGQVPGDARDFQRKIQFAFGDLCDVDLILKRLRNSKEPARAATLQENLTASIKANGEYAAEIVALKHDIERHTKITSEQATENERLTAERDAARAALEHDRSLVCDQYREIETVIQGYAWVLEGRGSYAWDDDKYRDEFKNVSSALSAALEPVKAVVKDWSNCPTDHQEITEARRDVEAERDAALARVEELETVLTPSSETKMRHWGEHEFVYVLPYHDVDNEDPDYSEEITVPWTTVKEIMKSISDHASARTALKEQS